MWNLTSRTRCQPFHLFYPAYLLLLPEWNPFIWCNRVAPNGSDVLGQNMWSGWKWWRGWLGVNRWCCTKRGGSYPRGGYIEISGVACQYWTHPAGADPGFCNPGGGGGGALPTGGGGFANGGGGLDVPYVKEGISLIHLFISEPF